MVARIDIERIQAWLAEHPEHEAVGQPRRFFYDGLSCPMR
jgi:hypothetical protein